MLQIPGILLFAQYEVFQAANTVIINYLLAFTMTRYSKYFQDLQSLLQVVLFLSVGEKKKINILLYLTTHSLEIVSFSFLRGEGEKGYVYWVFCLFLCMFTKCLHGPQKLAEGIRSSEIEVTQLLSPCGCWEPKTGPLQEKQVLLTTKSFLQQVYFSSLFQSI